MSVEFWTATLMLLFIMDPVGNIPVFHHTLQGVDEDKRWRVILREMLFAYGILLAFLFAGESILHFLGLKQASLSIASGIILFLIGLDIVFPRKGLNPDQEYEDPFIVPLAVPMVAGPSAIASILLLTSTKPQLLHVWFGSLTSAWAISVVILLSSNWLLHHMGHRGIRAIEKLIGMLLIMLSVQFFLDGVKAYLAGA